MSRTQSHNTYYTHGVMQPLTGLVSPPAFYGYDVISQFCSQTHALNSSEAQFALKLFVSALVGLFCGCVCGAI